MTNIRIRCKIISDPEITYRYALRSLFSLPTQADVDRTVRAGPGPGLHLLDPPRGKPPHILFPRGPGMPLLAGPGTSLSLLSAVWHPHRAVDPGCPYWAFERQNRSKSRAGQVRKLCCFIVPDWAYSFTRQCLLSQFSLFWNLINHFYAIIFQDFGSGSALIWLSWIQIQIRTGNSDPNPGIQIPTLQNWLTTPNKNLVG
jgi:hypothetical protein